MVFPPFIGAVTTPNGESVYWAKPRKICGFLRSFVSEDAFRCPRSPGGGEDRPAARDRNVPDEFLEFLGELR